MSGEKGRRNGTLDTVRFALILAVMIYHYTVRWRPPHNINDLYGYGYVYDDRLEILQYGVHIFFMISGFFIAATLARSSSAMAFLHNRLRRIYPSFLICASLTFALIAFMPTDFKVGLLDYALSLGFVADNLGAHHIDGAYWSLVVEMKFYAFAFLAFAGLGSRYWLGLLALALVGSAVGVFAPKIAKEILLAPYMPMFLAGVGLHYHDASRRRGVAFTLYAACVVLLAAHMNSFTLNGETSRLAAACVTAAMCAIVFLVRFNLRISLAPTAYLGLISYEIYLLHQKVGVTIIGVARREFGMPDFAAMLLATLSIVGLAALVHEVLQGPVRTVLDRAWTACFGHPDRLGSGTASTVRAAGPG